MIKSVSTNEKTYFGFQTVDTRIKSNLVQGIFSSIASDYDLMNDLMSGGIHRLWKSAFVNCLHPKVGITILDVAGGTGDIAFLILRYLKNLKAQITVCDLTPEMLSIGRKKALSIRSTSNIAWLCCKAESLPFPDCSVDVYTIAFGLRNVTDIRITLKEARRVLRPGGRFLCLEFSHVILPLLRDLYDQYSFTILPFLGEIITGDRNAYQYLVESIRRFPDQITLCKYITTSGLNLVKYQNLSGGIVAIHSAWRL